MKLLVKYNDDSTVEIAASDAQIGAIDTSKPGRVSYTIEYEGFSVTASITVKAKAVDDPTPSQATLVGITYLSGLNTNLFVGGELDTTVLKVTASYSDGSTKTIESKDLTTNIDEFDKFKAGEQTLVITYEGKTCNVTITVQEIKVTDFTIDYSTLDTSKTYYVGDTVDTSLVVGKAMYNNGTQKDLVNSDFTFSEIDNTTPGVKTLVISYSGVSKGVTFTFEAVAPVSLVYVSGNVPSVVYGEQIDTSDIKAMLRYNNGTTEDLTSTELTFEDIDTATPGNKMLTVKYGNLSFKLQYTVLDITSITLINVNNQVKVGADIDCTKAQLKLTLSNNQIKYVTEGFNIDTSAFSSDALGNTSVTVTYKNETTTFNIEVVEILGDPTLTGIEITGGVKNEIFEGETFSYDNITLVANFSDNQTLNLERSDVTVEGTVGTTPGTYTLTIKYTYDGDTKTCEYTVTVVEVVVTNLVLNLEEVRIERNPANTQPNLSTLTATAIYNNGTRKALTLNELTVGTVDVTTAGERTLTVTYEEGTDTIKVVVVEPTVTDVKLIGQYANTHIVGEAYNKDGVKAEVYYSNGEVIIIDNALSNVTFNESTGELTVTFGGKSDTKTIKLLTITSVAIDTETFNTAPMINSFSTEGLKLIVYLSDGSNVTRDVTHGVVINASGVDAAHIGTYYMTASYMGVTSANVEIIVLEDQEYIITGVAYPEGIALWKANTLQENFLDKGYNYAVGDDNPFKFELPLTYRNKDTDEIFTKYIAYTSVSKVYDSDGNEVGADIVEIDEVNHTFNFTEAAVGKCYRITTRPANITPGAEALFTKELVVEVVDGFNVHDEIELNVLTNVKNKSIGKSGYDQLTVVYKFMKNNVDFARDMTQEEYEAFVNGINGVVIHDFLKFETTDFPDEYFFVTADKTKYLWDHFALFYHDLVKTDRPFNFYGNYFQMDTNAIPCVAAPGTVDEYNNQTNNVAEDPTSNSEIFRFNIPSSIFNAAVSNNAFDHTAYKANFYAIAMSDNDRSVAEQTEAERVRSTLGAYAFKLAKGEYSFNSVNIQRYYISVMNEYDSLTVNYDYCTFHDSWNNHISIWADNDMDEKDDTNNVSVYEGYSPIKINITNSFIAKCGGPVIMSICNKPAETRNAGSVPEVVIDDKSQLFSYVTGQESWFINYGATDILPTIVQISDYFFAPNNAQFTTLITEGNTKFANIIYLNISGDGLLGLTDDLDAKLTIGGKTLVDMTDTSIYLHPATGEPTQGNYGNAYVDTVMTGAKLSGSTQLPPVFVSSKDGCAYYNGTALADTMGPIFEGDKLALYYNNMGILLGYNEAEIPHEPTPRENTTIERVTNAHGYN